MSDIPAAASPIQLESTQFRSPVSESLMQTIGGSINYLLSLGLSFVEFTTNGTWTVPANVTQIMLFGCGGGGGGGGSAGNSTHAGGPGLSCKCEATMANVTPGDTVTVTVGAGGNGGTGGSGGTGNTNGQTGGNTVFSPTMNPTLTFLGGTGGLAGNLSSNPSSFDRLASYHSLGGGNSEFQSGLAESTAFSGGTNTSYGYGTGAGTFGPGTPAISAQGPGTDATSTNYGVGGVGGAGIDEPGGDAAQGVLFIVYFGVV